MGESAPRRTFAETALRPNQRDDLPIITSSGAKLEGVLFWRRRLRSRYSEAVGRPHTEVIDVFCSGGLQEPIREEVDVDGIDIDMRGNLPFGVKVVLFAEESFVISRAWHQWDPWWLIECVMRAVPPQKVNSRRNRKVGQRLHRHRRE